MIRGRTDREKLISLNSNKFLQSLKKEREKVKFLFLEKKIFLCQKIKNKS